jgi:membrane-associated phospholipid phosphatase
VARSVKAPIAAWLACAVALVLLALVAYGVNSAQHLDGTLLARLMASNGSRQEAVANVIAHLGDPLPLLVLLALACGIALWRGRPVDAAAAVTVVAGSNLTTQVLKVLLSHPRYQSVLGPHQLGPVAFPSGHATAAASIAIAFLFVVPRAAQPLTALVGACFVAAVGISVLVLEWHYPSDVLGGILVASGWGFAVLAARRAFERRVSSSRPQAPSRSPISVK